jgi:DNA-binding IclR family transcriptional regulator
LERLASGGRWGADALADGLGRPVAEVHSGLLVLELHGLARRGLDGAYEAAE